ncbi:MAG: HAD-IA family hydrolase [Gemmatimonadota bacterium]|nr:HAD-IA family hydrolase [Gemmatimonadota bacterium]
MPSRHPLTAVLFDLDGTLIDSIALIVNSALYAFEKCGHPAPAAEEWLADLGLPLRTMFGRFIADESKLAELVAGYREYQLENHDRLVRPYEEVSSTLTALHERGHSLAVVTSKAEPLAHRGLAHVGLDGFFDVVVGLESCTRHKPDPEPVRVALDRLAVRPEDAAFVGDSPHDMAAGRGAGVVTVAALWGPFNRSQLASSEPDYYIERMGELLPIVGADDNA